MNAIKVTGAPQIRVQFHQTAGKRNAGKGRKVWAKFSKERFLLFLGKGGQHSQSRIALVLYAPQFCMGQQSSGQKPIFGRKVLKSFDLEDTSMGLVRHPSTKGQLAAWGK